MTAFSAKHAFLFDQISRRNHRAVGVFAWVASLRCREDFFGSLLGPSASFRYFGFDFSSFSCSLVLDRRDLRRSCFVASAAP